MERIKLFSIVVVIIMTSSMIIISSNNTPGNLGKNSNINNSADVKNSSSLNSTNSLNISSPAKSINQTPYYEYMPNLNSLNNGSSSVAPLYNYSPAPMGLADYGLKNSSKYEFNTTSFEAMLNVSNISSYSPGYPNLANEPNWLSVQFNTVMRNVNVQGKNDTFWTQNVAYTNGKSLTFIDNVWNFTSKNLAMPNSTVYSGNGIVSNSEFYYRVGPTINITEPFTLTLYNNATLINNRSAIFFNYTVTENNKTVSGSYDRVIFNSSKAAHNPEFTVNGYKKLPNKLLYDAELIFGGPGGGTNAVMNSLNATAKMRYLNNSSYTSIKSAYDYGSDSGETSSGMSAYYNGATEYLHNGPSLLYGLWNTTGGVKPGYIKLDGKVNANAFAFVGINGTKNYPYNLSYAPLTGSNLELYLPPDSYNVTLLLNNYNEYNFTFNKTKTKSIAMIPHTGLYYTPIYNNPGNISGITITLDPLFNRLNDYGYPVFILVSLNDVNHVTLSNIKENNNKYYYDNGKSITIKNLNDEIDVFNSRNININNIGINDNSLMLFNTTASELSNINIVGVNDSLSIVLEFSSHIDVSNVNIYDAVGILSYYSNHIDELHITSHSGSIGSYNCYSSFNVIENSTAYGGSINNVLIHTSYTVVFNQTSVNANNTYIINSQNDYVYYLFGYNETTKGCYIGLINVFSDNIHIMNVTTTNFAASVYDYASNNVSVNNVTSYGGVYSIYLHRSDNNYINRISGYNNGISVFIYGNDNTVFNSTFNRDQSYGVDIYSGNNNYVYFNNFISNNNNSINKIQAFSSPDNYFSVSSTGNYWSNEHYYNGSIMPYYISNNVFDYHPLKEQTFIKISTITFIASNLPENTAWSITIDNKTVTSTHDTISFNLPDNTYNYTITENGKNYTGKININENKNVGVNLPVKDHTRNYTSYIYLAIIISAIAIIIGVFAFVRSRNGHNSAW